MMMKVDLAVLGVPPLSEAISEDRPDDESLEGTMVLQYLNGLYGDLEMEMADRIKRVRDNHRLWVVAGIRNL
jgi:hypothetical protein